MSMLKIKKGDTVKVIAGKDKDKEGKVKRHTKPNQKAPNGGIIEKEAPMFASKVMVVCPACSKATRVAKREIDGKMVRVCKKCGEALDQAK